jgi:hypothetical protein
MPGGYKILDRNGVVVACVYAIDGAHRALTSTDWLTLTWDEARRGIARLPELLQAHPRRKYKETDRSRWCLAGAYHFLQMIAKLLISRA